MRLKVTLAIILLLFCFCANISAEEKWREYKSYHFIIYYKEAPRNFIESVEEMAEYYYREIADNLGFMRHESWSWDKRAKIYIYEDAEDYINAAMHSEWSSGMAAVKDKVIRTYPAAHGFFDSTLPHELGHIIFREFIGFNSRIPLWLEEGVAMYQEKAKRWGANRAVLSAIKKDKFIPLQKLSKMRLYNDTPKETINLFYTEAASVVYYIITELGEYKFVSFCRKLKDGDSFEKALQDTYMRFKNIRDLNDSWVYYLEHKK